MAEPEGNSGSETIAEASPLPEGAEGLAEGAALGQGVPPLRTGAHAPAGLDILVEADEPEALMQRLERIAWARQGEPRWDIVRRNAKICLAEFEIHNRPASHR